MNYLESLKQQRDSFLQKHKPVIEEFLDKNDLDPEKLVDAIFGLYPRVYKFYQEAFISDCQGCDRLTEPDYDGRYNEGWD